MDLNRLQNDQKLKLCIWYFKGRYQRTYVPKDQAVVAKVFHIFIKFLILVRWICVASIHVGDKRRLVLQGSVHETSVRGAGANKEM